MPEIPKDCDAEIVEAAAAMAMPVADLRAYLQHVLNAYWYPRDFALPTGSVYEDEAKC